MSCCGEHRRMATTPIEGVRPGGGASPRQPRIRPLEYTGSTALTVLGPATGRIYRFRTPGARLAVDPRDWAALERLPSLR